MRAERLDPHRAVEEGTEVVTRYAVGGVGEWKHGSGRVVAYSDSPMFLIRCEDGSSFWWRADLTEAAPVPHPAATDPSDGGGGRG